MVTPSGKVPPEAGVQLTETLPVQASVAGGGHHLPPALSRVTVMFAGRLSTGGWVSVTNKVTTLLVGTARIAGHDVVISAMNETGLMSRCCQCFPMLRRDTIDSDRSITTSRGAERRAGAAFRGVLRADWQRRRRNARRELQVRLAQ